VAVRKRTAAAVVDAIRYVIHNGCVWRTLPADFPPWRTVYGIYQRWNASGTTLALHDALRGQVRQATGRTIEPTAAVIDSQSVRAAATVPKASRGWDNAKKVNGRKRHIAVDTTGLLLEVLVTPASTQDRDAARPLLWNLKRARRRVRHAWADGGYAGKLQPWAATWLKMTVEVVKRPGNLHTFQVLPRRWVVERTLAWITSYRRCARDYERLPAHHEAVILWAMITTMTRRLARLRFRNKHLEARPQQRTENARICRRPGQMLHPADASFRFSGAYAASLRVAGFGLMGDLARSSPRTVASECLLCL
jgi:putative transposase